MNDQAQAQAQAQAPALTGWSRVRRYLLIGILAVLLVVLGYMLGTHRHIVNPATSGGVAANPLVVYPTDQSAGTKTLIAAVPAGVTVTALSGIAFRAVQPELDPPSDRVLALYREAARQRPDDADANRTLAVALYSKGDLDGALAEFRKCVTLRPNDPTAHNDLGVVLYKKGERAAALEEFRAASRLDPSNHTNAQSNYLLVEWDQEDLKRAQALKTLKLAAGEQTVVNAGKAERSPEK